MPEQLDRINLGDPPTKQSSVGTSLLFGSGQGALSASYDQRPSHETRLTLLNIFRDRVDSIFKVTHWPSLVETFVPERADHSLTPAQKALEACIYFAATCALTDDELGERELITHQYRDSAEASLARADLLSSHDLIVLQGFAIFLAALRTTNTDAASWALVALLIRLAEAQDLGTDSPSSRSPFEVEMRRRLWISIGVLDVQSAFDRGTKLLLGHELDPPLPVNINDDQISPSSTVAPLPSPTSQPTEMTLCCMTHRAVICQRRLNSAGMVPEDANKSTSEIWAKKVNIVNSFKAYVDELGAICAVSSTPFTRYAVTCGHGCLVTMKLLMRRPIQRQIHAKPPPEDDFNTLELATEVLERSILRYHPEFWPWTWFAWVKWYALAIVLAELCARPDAPGWDRHWRVAKDAFESYATMVADSDSGLLWKPVKRLMQKARERMGAVEVQMAAPPAFGVVEGGLQAPPPVSLSGNSGPSIAVGITGGMAPLPSWDAGSEGATSWINWESFIDDVSQQGKGWGSWADPSFSMQ